MIPTAKSQFEILFQKLLTALKLQGLRPKTIDCYSRALRKTAVYFDYAIEDLSKDQLIDYFSQLVDSRSWSTVKIARNALQFFYKHVLEKEWDWISIVKPPKVQTLPEIITQEEVPLVLNAVIKPNYRVFFCRLQYGATIRRNINLTPERY